MRAAWALLVAVAIPATLYAAVPGALPAGPATRQQVLHGRYLVTAAVACADCHSSTDQDRLPSGSRWLAGYVAGVGQPFQIGRYQTYAGNLTPDKTARLGNWTPRQVFAALRTGKDPEGRYLAPPMPWPVYRNMTDADTWAIVAYLRSIKPVRNIVPKSQGDWADAYRNLRPLPAYPAANEIAVKQARPAR